jgi:hypothetical protein
MPVNGLITFQNQALYQLGIDPAFGEANLVCRAHLAIFECAGCWLI